jgi:hypothetical protein
MTNAATLNNIALLLSVLFRRTAALACACLASYSANFVVGLVWMFCCFFFDAMITLRYQTPSNIRGSEIVLGQAIV